LAIGSREPCRNPLLRFADQTGQNGNISPPTRSWWTSITGITNNYFLVTEWSADRIVATDILNPMTQLIIHPMEKRVELLHYIVTWLGNPAKRGSEPVTVSYELK
jgi:hypothetical protein